MIRSIVDVILVLGIAGGLSWLAQVWRLEGQEYLNAKARYGGIVKTRLISEGDRIALETTQYYEAKAREAEALSVGEARAEAEGIVAAGNTRREISSKPDLAAQHELMSALLGINQSIAELDKRIAAGPQNGEIEETTAQAIVRLYLIEAAKVIKSDDSLKRYGRSGVLNSRRCKPNMSVLRDQARFQREQIWSKKLDRNKPYSGLP